MEVCGANPPGLGYCPATCKKRDDTKCGIQYSSPVQSAFCPVPTPSSWPAAVSVSGQPTACIAAATILPTHGGQHAVVRAPGTVPLELEPLELELENVTLMLRHIQGCD